MTTNTTLKTIDGYSIAVTPRNAIVIQTPADSTVFVSGVDKRGLALTRFRLPIPAPVLRAAGDVYTRMEVAAKRSREDELCEPPADLTEDEGVYMTGAEMIHGIEELRF